MQPRLYPNELKVKDALKIYFAKYHFANGGYDQKYFRIKIGPLFIPVPNTKSRIKAVKLHDIHHLLTEYTALWKGEVEIGAWEISSGCGDLLVAWLLNFGSFSVGLFLYPKALFKAFQMGRHVKTNLYYSNYQYTDLLDKSVGELRSEFRIGQKEALSPVGTLYFILWAALTITLLAGSLFLLCRGFN